MEHADKDSTGKSKTLTNLLPFWTVCLVAINNSILLLLRKVTVFLFLFDTCLCI